MTDSDPQTVDTTADLDSLWRWMSIPLFFYCGAMWLRTQTDNFELIKFIAKTADVACIAGLFAIPVAFASIYVAVRYAEASGGRKLCDRIPRVIEKGLDGRTGETFRTVLYCGFWFVILGSQFHFIQGVMTGSMVNTDTCERFKGAGAMLFNSTTATNTDKAADCKPLLPSAAPTRWDNRFRFAHVNGATYFPVIETWALLLSMTAVVFYFGWYVRTKLSGQLT